MPTRPSALVTGSSRGIGRAIAVQLAARGVRLALHYQSNRAAAEATLASLAGEGHALFAADLLDAAAPAQLWSAVTAAFGQVDVLVNNAGIYELHPPLSTDAAGWARAWERTLAANLFAPAKLSHLASQAMAAAGGGRIVNIASTEAIVTTAGLAAYAATKAGVVGLTKSFAVELGRHGITVNCICPGPINTGMTAGIDDAAKETYAKRRVPLRRYGQPEEVAHMTVSLCMPASSFVNGAIIPVDGGMTIRHT